MVPANNFQQSCLRNNDPAMVPQSIVVSDGWVLQELSFRDETKVLTVPSGVLFVFPGKRPRENVIPIDFFTIFGPFRSKPGHAPRCINRSVVQFLEPRHTPCER